MRNVGTPVNSPPRPPPCYGCRNRSFFTPMIYDHTWSGLRCLTVSVRAVRAIQVQNLYDLTSSLCHFVRFYHHFFVGFGWMSVIVMRCKRDVSRALFLVCVHVCGLCHYFTAGLYDAAPHSSVGLDSANTFWDAIFHRSHQMKNSYWYSVPPPSFPPPSHHRSTMMNERLSDTQVWNTMKSGWIVSGEARWAGWKWQGGTNKPKTPKFFFFFFLQRHINNMKLSVSGSCLFNNAQRVAGGFWLKWRCSIFIITGCTSTTLSGADVSGKSKKTLTM